MPVIHRNHKRYGGALSGANKDSNRLIPAIVIGIVGFFCLICYVFLRQKAQKRRGLGTHHALPSGGPDRRPRNGSDPVIQSWDNRRREQASARAAERRRLDEIALQQVNAQLTEDTAEPKPPGYAPPVQSMPDVDGTPTSEIARPVPAAHREGYDLPGYAPRTSLRRSSNRVGADLDDAVIEAIVADPPPAYTPRPGDTSTTAPVNRAVT